MWIDELKEEKIKLGLERIEKFIEEIGKPEYKVIHVGGTNGKGSVCQFIANILMEDGKKVGVYTSPHLERVNERIVVNSNEISDEELESYVYLKKYNFTYFEALTAIAIDYFQKKQVDYAVFEVGLGGRLDATNVLPACITVITNVAMEHENYLGDSIEKIAMEKAGIIKDAPVITASKGKSLEIIKRVAKEKGVDLFVLGENFSYDIIEKNRFLIKANEQYEIESPLQGKFQAENIAIAIKCAEILGIEKEKIIKGIKKAKWPGRMEKIENFLIDGCHNPHAIKAFVESLEDFSYDRLIIIFGAMKDKKIDKMIELLPKATYIAAQCKAKRATLAEKIAEIGKKEGKKFIIADSVKEAIKMAKKMAGKNDLICIIGSLYLAGEARKILREKYEAIEGNSKRNKEKMPRVLVE